MLDSLKNNYQLISKIGEGSFSEVIKVRDKKTFQLFAAKRLKKVFASIEEVEEYNELKTLKRLEYHPNVLNLVEYIYEPEEGCLTLVFNLMDMSLYDYIKDRKKKLPEMRCKVYLYQLLQGLSFLHKSGIFHRDIKPENILLHIDESLKKTNPNKAELVQLGDLGSVSYTSYPLPRSEYISTRWYRAPECLLTSGYYGPKMDVWALGCCFYEMVTLQPLFPGDNEIDQLHKIHEIIGSPSKELLKRFKHLNVNMDFPKRTPIDFKQIVSNLSIYGLDILKRMLMYHPENRQRASKLIENIYFDDIRNRMSTSISYRLLYSSRSDSNRGTAKSFSPFKEETSDTTANLRRLKGLKAKLTKSLERGWNMNECPTKTSILANIKSSVSNQSQIMASRSSQNSCNFRK